MTCEQLQARYFFISTFKCIRLCSSCARAANASPIGSLLVEIVFVFLNERKNFPKPIKTREREKRKSFSRSVVLAIKHRGTINNMQKTRKREKYVHRDSSTRMLVFDMNKQRHRNQPTYTRGNLRSDLGRCGGRIRISE